MRIVVDRTPGAPQIRLEEAGEFGSLHIEPADPEQGISAEQLSSLGRLSGGRNVFVDPNTIRALAGARASDDSWSAGFEAMIEYAERRGWLSPAGEIRVHIIAASE
ncbi:hypothetical protein [Rhodococcus jostii]|uniref:Uncharacterized protein n=1 Tax=Rhodococcus jostii TaxID=132919 RepID=A0A1H4S4E4_RHOJO|nr:hypothetical protein [Rhodococcus jostii]SEC38741.1 hypothetical protein SAMN04490220_1504 [Rhodococcus jostii]